MMYYIYIPHINYRSIYKSLFGSFQLSKSFRMVKELVSNHNYKLLNPGQQQNN